MTEHVLFFDIDGTMLSTGGAGQRAMELALAEEFRIADPFQQILTAGRTDRGIEDEIFERYSIPATQASRQRFMRAYLDRLPHCLQQLPGGLLPGVQELLQGLSLRTDVHLSLLTGNYFEGALIKLRHFGIAGFFEDSGGFGDHHADRNDVAHLALSVVRQRLQRPVQGSEAVVIGDTPAVVRCARAIGARAVAVATGVYTLQQLQTTEPDHVFETLGSTEDVISKLLTKV